MSYLKHSNLSVRMGLNPIHWCWLPRVTYEKPTEIYPKRKTFGIVWLFLEVYIDIDDGTEDFTKLMELLSRSTPWDQEPKEEDGLL